VGGSAEVLGKLSAAAAKATGLRRAAPRGGRWRGQRVRRGGRGARLPGEAVASWGTSGTVLTPTATPLVDPGMRAHTFCHAVPNTWYLMGVMLSAGGAFAWYQREVARELAKNKNASLRLNEEAAAIAPGAEGLTFLPYLQASAPRTAMLRRAAPFAVSAWRTRART